MSYSSGGGGASFLGSSFFTYFLGSYFLASTFWAAGAGAIAAVASVTYDIGKDQGAW